jgi:hypothetical protein
MGSFLDGSHRNPDLTHDLLRLLLTFAEATTDFRVRENVLQGLANVKRQYDPKVVGIAKTCLAETIGEDVVYPRTARGGTSLADVRRMGRAMATIEFGSTNDSAKTAGALILDRFGGRSRAARGRFALQPVIC